MCLCVLLLTSILVPNREHPEYEGAERGGKISPPVIPHRKVGRRDLNTEQHPWWWWRERGGERRRTEREKGLKRRGKMRMDCVRYERRRRRRRRRRGGFEKDDGEREREREREGEETEIS